MSSVPEIRITASPDVLRDVRVAVEACCGRKGFNSADIDEIAKFEYEGINLSAITLKLNYGEGAALFKGDKLLDKELGLFAGNAVHTKAHLEEMTERNAAGGVNVERSPPLEQEFHDLVTRAEANIRGKADYKPKVPTSLDDAFTNNHVVVVGEIHAHEAPRLTIASKLPEVAAHNGALVVEHLYGNRNDLLKGWLASLAGTPMPPLLELSANAISSKLPDGTDDPQYYGTKRLIEDAKNAGVKEIRGYETDATLANNYLTIEQNPSAAVKFGNSSEYPRGYYDYRVLAMNEAARETIDDLLKTHDKIIMSTGAAHAISQDAKGVPSVADHFGGAQLVVVDGKEAGSVRTNRLPWWEGLNKEKTVPDFLLITDDPSKLKQQRAATKAMEATPQQSEVDGSKKKTSSQPSSHAVPVLPQDRHGIPSAVRGLANDLGKLAGVSLSNMEGEPPPGMVVSPQPTKVAVNVTSPGRSWGQGS